MSWIDEWIKEVDQMRHKCVLVFPRNEFGEVYDRLSGRDDVAFVSIEDSDGVDKHLAPSSRNILNLEFDDVDNDGEAEGRKTISEEQSSMLAAFISEQIPRHFIIHCTAGRSRSQGVARVIFDCFPDIYQECRFNRFNPCTTPNYSVVAAVKRQFWNF